MSSRVKLCYFKQGRTYFYKEVVKPCKECTCQIVRCTQIANLNEGRNDYIAKCMNCDHMLKGNWATQQEALTHWNKWVIGGMTTEELIEDIQKDLE